MTGDRDVISLRTLAIIDGYAGRRLRVRYRSDPEVFGDLLRIEQKVIAWRLTGGANTTDLAPAADPAASLLTTGQVAALVGVSPNAIRRACCENRISATKHGHIWLVDITEAARYASSRRH